MNRRLGWPLLAFTTWCLHAPGIQAEEQDAVPLTGGVPSAPVSIAPAGAETGFQIQAMPNDPDAYLVVVTQKGVEAACPHHVWFGNPCLLRGLGPGPATVIYSRVGTDHRAAGTIEIPSQGGVAILDNRKIPPLWKTGLGLGLGGAIVEVAGLILEFTGNTDTCLKTRPCLTGLVFDAVGFAAVLSGSFIRLAAYQAMPELRPMAPGETAQPGGRAPADGPSFGGVGLSVQPNGSSLLLSWKF